MTLHVLNHPLIQENVSVIRSKDTSLKDFREAVETLSMLMAYPLTADLSQKDILLETPLMKTNGQKLADRIILVPILRAGLGMLEGMRRMLPEASVGFLGMARNEETLVPEVYYAKFPADLKEAQVIVLDPMLATGGSASEALTELKNMGAQKMKLACLVGAPEGVSCLAMQHADVDIYLCALDNGLNEHGYILPGLGDAGDRLFGTED